MVRVLGVLGHAEPYRSPDCPLCYLHYLLTVVSHIPMRALLICMVAYLAQALSSLNLYDRLRDDESLTENIVLVPLSEFRGPNLTI